MRTFAPDLEAIQRHIADNVPMAPPLRLVTAEDAVRAEADEVLAADPPSTPAPEQSGEMPAHLLDVPGLVGHTTRWILKTSRHPLPPLALAAALVVVGTAAGRKYSGPTNSGTHLYALGLAPTGAGKNHSAKMAKRLMRAANMDELMGPSQFMSESAVYQVMAAQPLLVCFMDEFGSYLQKINNPKTSDAHAKAISGVMRTLWGESFGTVNPPAWASKDKLKPIHSPALSVYGMSVHEEFYAALQSADVANGFLNRFLIFSTRVRAEEVEPELYEGDMPPKLVDWLQRIAQTTRAPGSIRPDHWEAEVRLDWASAEARLHYREFRRSTEQRGDDAQMLSRAAEMGVRLATIRAIGRTKVGPCAVDLDDIRWGCELAMWSAERMLADAKAYMVESVFQGMAKEVVRHLQAAGGRLTHTELSRKIKHKFDAPTLRKILDTLRDSDDIEVVRIKADGAKKPTDVIRLTGGIK